MYRIIIAIAALLIIVIVWFGISAARHEAEKVIEHQVETKIINVVKPLAPKVVPTFVVPRVSPVDIVVPHVPQQPVRDWNLDVAPAVYSTGTFRWEQQDGVWDWKWYGNPKKQAVSGCANGMCGRR